MTETECGGFAAQFGSTTNLQPLNVYKAQSTHFSFSFKPIVSIIAIQEPVLFMNVILHLVESSLLKVAAWSYLLVMGFMCKR